MRVVAWFARVLRLCGQFLPGDKRVLHGLHSRQLRLQRAQFHELVHPQTKMTTNINSTCRYTLRPRSAGIARAAAVARAENS
jgi:hypothetical protein